MKIRPVQCPTCPFRDDVDEEHKSVMELTMEMSINTASRICHSTGSNNAFHKRTGKPEMICRGARNFQLQLLAAIGFLEAPTDQAWIQKCKELGIKPDNMKIR